MTDDNEFVFVPLGGLGEIGMNCALYGYGPANARQWLMVDLGVGFADEDLPGVDLIMPDLSFIEKAKKNLVGIVITHAHEDHIGALAELWPDLGAPVYMTRFAAGLVEARRLGEPGAPEIPLKVVELGEKVVIGPFEVEFIPVAHSIPESSALAIRTPAGLVVHTADWKIDPTPIIGLPTDEARFKALGDEGVLALVCDSTNILREGESPSERDVAKTLACAHRQREGQGGRDHLRFQRRPAALRGRGWLRRRAAGLHSRPGDRARRRGRARVRDARRPAAVLGHGCVRAPAARPDIGARHRQPGRAARSARAHGGGRASDGGIERRRHRDLFVAHHSRQREGGRQDHQRVCDARASRS